MGRINLIQEFSKQKKNKFIVLTTFNFDPYFFDLYLLPLLQKQNIGAEIVILIDEGQYNLQYSKFTSITGVAYHLIPIKLKNGVFHPKFFLFVSDKTATTYSGSANLTLQGFTNNAELVLKSENTQESYHAKEILENLVSKKIIENEQISQIIKKISDKINKKDVDKNDKNTTVHNLFQPILVQALEEIKEDTFDELFILAPFISENGKPLEEILKKKTIKKIVFALQKGNHNLTTLDIIEEICSKYNTQIEVKSAEFLDKISEKELPVQRRFHSKILFLRGKIFYMLTGSPNFTSSALLETIDSGNFEHGTIWKDVSDVMLEPIKIESSDNTLDILATSRPQFTGISSSLIHIKSAVFDIKTGILKIVSEPKNESYQIKISFKDSEQKTISENFSSGSVEIQTEKTPIGIEISDGKNSVKRRIFDDSDIKRRISRSGFSISVWTERVGEILNMDSTAMLDIIRVLNGYSKIEVEHSESKEKSRVEKHHDYLPTSIKTPKNFATTINLISNIMEKNKQEKTFQKTVEQSSTEEEISEIDKESRKQIKQYDSLHEMKIWIENIHSLLLSATKKKPEESLINSITVYIATFVKFIPGILQTDEADIRSLKKSSNVVFDLFSNKLTSMFQYLGANDLINGHSQNLLLNLLCLKHLTGITTEHINLGLALFYHDFTDKKTFYEIMDFVKKFLEKYETSFDKKDFVEGYVHYGKFGFEKDTEYKIKTLVQIISKENDTEFLDYLKKLFESVFDRYPKSFFDDLKYDSVSEGGKFIQEVIQNYEDPHAWMDNPW